MMDTSTQVLAPPMASPPPKYKSSSNEEIVIVPVESPLEHHHAPISAQQDLQYHQLFTRPSTDVDLNPAAGPVAKLITSYGDSDEIKSNDSRLSDATVLFESFKLKASEPAELKVSVHGYHTETEVYYTQRVNPNTDRVENVRQTRTVTVTDFLFYIPVVPFLSGQPADVTLHVLDDSPAANTLGWDARQSEKWKKKNGLPGWARDDITRQLYDLKNPTEPLPAPDPAPSSPLGMESPDSVKEKDLELGLSVVQHSAAGFVEGLKELCERYAQDSGRLKRIEMKVEFYGWDTDKLVTAIERCIRGTGYGSAISVEFNSSPKKYIVRPNNSLTRLRRKPFLMFLACITFVYPMIWIMLRLTGKGGKKYNTVRADHALKTYKPVEGTFPGETLIQAHARLHPGEHGDDQCGIGSREQLVTGPMGVYSLKGLKEGDWLRTWEENIAKAAAIRFRGDLVEGVVLSRAAAGEGLDGY